jgi:hypothetical protein
MKLLKVILFITLAGCAGSNGQLDTSSHDPRCVAACPVTMPEVSGAGAVCDTASRAQCLDECEARIAGLPSLCQSCLLEHACFEPGCGSGDVSIGGSCDQDTCTIVTGFGTCTYATDDQAAYDACLQKVDPRRDVACQVEFRSTTECATVCT